MWIAAELSQLEEKKTQGSRRGSNPGPPALAEGAFTTELRLPTATWALIIQL